MPHMPASRPITLSPSEYRAEMRNEMSNGTNPSYMEVLEPAPPTLPSSSSARLMPNLVVNPSSYGYQAHTPVSGLDPSFPVAVMQPTSTEAGRLSTFPVMQPTGTLPPPVATHPVSRKKHDTDSFVFYDPNTK
ncbi:uncharacterized protein ARMOST_04163 [Armillaria ostoyae]|uniref:Uncharacterized protein n=1 Tax=Armillaria ostoyae TaxID=47428 RepID=A0A284QWP3_ARMOS|nr:uncharacterized protein ARMOST_04163 [Armillaria ostoyae]